MGGHSAQLLNLSLSLRGHEKSEDTAPALQEQPGEA